MKYFSFVLTGVIIILSLAGCGSVKERAAPFSTIASESQNAESSAAEMTEETVEVTADKTEDEPAEKTETSGTKILVAYFSATGTTKTIAEYIAETVGADLFEVVPADAYSSEDLNYSEDTCRANQEQKDSTMRPQIAGQIENMEGYDVIFIGHPIWWGEEPRIIDTFVESHDLSGKTVIDFCTSGGSGIGTSESNLKKLCPSDVNWLEGRRFSSDSELEDVRQWTESLELNTTN